MNHSEPTSTSGVKPVAFPANPCFSSGPCAKPPTWSLNALMEAPLGRSHRAAIGKEKLKAVIVNTGVKARIYAAELVKIDDGQMATIA